MPNNYQNDLWEGAWSLLLRGQSDPKSAFATPVVATVSPDGVPHSRTLVLRKALKEKGELWCYTDRRSQKAIDLSEGSEIMSWTFWDPKKKIQVNAIGTTRWLDKEICDERFRQLPKHSRKSYASLLAPGRVVKEYTDGLPENWQQRDLSETDYAKENFGILSTRIEQMIILQLRREGHRRMLAERIKDSKWQFIWLIP